MYIKLYIIFMLGFNIYFFLYLCLLSIYSSFLYNNSECCLVMFLDMFYELSDFLCWGLYFFFFFDIETVNQSKLKRISNIMYEIIYGWIWMKYNVGKIMCTKNIWIWVEYANEEAFHSWVLKYKVKWLEKEKNFTISWKIFWKHVWKFQKQNSFDKKQ